MLLNCLCDALAALPDLTNLGVWRRELVGQARGRVLEIGAGTGSNLPHYVGEVDLTLLEPDKRFRGRLEYLGHTAIRGFAEELPFPDASFDTVVCTLVMCSVRDVDAAVGEIRRVLKPQGRYLFLEHVLASEPSARRWQHRLDPAWSRLAGGCHLTREFLPSLHARFDVEGLIRDRVQPAPSFVRETVRGLASFSAPTGTA